MQRQPPQIVAALHENVERAKLDFIVVLPGMQRVEIGDAVHTQDDGVAIDPLGWRYPIEQARSRVRLDSRLIIDARLSRSGYA